MRITWTFSARRAHSCRTEPHSPQYKDSWTSGRIKQYEGFSVRLVSAITWSLGWTWQTVNIKCFKFGVVVTYTWNEAKSGTRRGRIKNSNFSTYFTGLTTRCDGNESDRTALGHTKQALSEYIATQRSRRVMGKGKNKIYWRFRGFTQEISVSGGKFEENDRRKRQTSNAIAGNAKCKRSWNFAGRLENRRKRKTDFFGGRTEKRSCIIEKAAWREDVEDGGKRERNGKAKPRKKTQILEVIPTREFDSRRQQCIEKQHKFEN